VREIKYKQTGEIIEITEGYMQEGVYIGFSRVVEISMNKLWVKSGYWKTEKDVLIPHGKFQWHQITINGQIKTICPPGIYTGVQEGYRVRLLRCPGK
jgi:hypothetical protein